MSRLPRILVVNPNMSGAVTGMLAAEACRVAGPAVEIRAVTAAFGVAAIQTEADAAVAVQAVTEALAANGDCDAAIIAAFGDPGLDRARTEAPMPVVGLGQSGVLAAGAGGRPFGIVTIGAAMRGDIESKVARCGVREQLVALRFLPGTVPDLIRDRAAYRSAIADAVAACIVDGAQAVLLGGAPFAGIHREIDSATEVPVLDGLGAAVAAALDEMRRFRQVVTPASIGIARR
jgi:allantoin racemase